MPDRAPIWIAIAGGCLVSCVTFAVLGWNAPAAFAAARNTARFSAFCYVLAMASPGVFLLSSQFSKLGETSRELGLPEEFRLVQAFVAAHMVHFATVAVVIVVFNIGRIEKDPVGAAIKIAGGFAVVAAVGLTARMESGWQSVLHKALFYLVFAIFLLALSRSLVPRILDALLVTAFVLRMVSWKHVHARVVPV